MKKGLLMIMMVIAIITAKAQTPLNENGVYELKVVQEYENINANNIYERTLLALSDVMGSNKHSKTNIDVQDKEGGILVFKGRYFIGYRKVNVSGGYFHYADLTLKVRCKDGKAQITITVPTIHAALPNGQTKTWTMREVVELNEKASPRKVEKEKKKTHGMNTREIVELLLTEMETALKNDPDDDF